MIKNFFDFCFSNNTVCVRNSKGVLIPLPRYYRKKFGYNMDFQSVNVKTQLDNLSRIKNKPVEELSQREISSYFAQLFVLDEDKRMYNYNHQIKF